MKGGTGDVKRGDPLSVPAPDSESAHTLSPSIVNAVLFAPQLAGSAVIAFGLWFRFGGTIKDLSSEDKSPEYFYMGE